MMPKGGKQSSLRKALGAFKDTTTVGLAKVHGGYKELNINIVKATNHEESPSKEKHTRAIFTYISSIRPRADVSYCIHALARRLSRTSNWAVALKTLIVIHRAIREVDSTFQEELVTFIKIKGHMLNMAHFKDDSGPHAWDYSAWVRNYALFLEERLECFRVLKYDVEAARSRTKDLDTPDLLDQLPALQQLLFRIIGCQPQGAAVHNFVIKTALSMVASESIKVYNSIKDGTINLVDKFFEMKRHDAQKAFDIYRRSAKQAERLSEFYELCRNLDVGRGEKYPTIEQPPGSFLQSMEEYIRDAPRASTLRKDLAIEAPKVIVAIDYKKSPEEEKRPPSPSPPRTEPEPVKVEAPVQTPDLLGLDNPIPEDPASDEKTASALAIVPVGKFSDNLSLQTLRKAKLIRCSWMNKASLHPLIGEFSFASAFLVSDMACANNQSTNTGPDLANGGTSWELALVSTPNSSDSAAASKREAGAMDKLMLDSLYDDAIRRSNPHVGYNSWEQPSLANPTYNPFYASNTLAAASTVQMAAMASQQQAYMLQQQQMMMMMNPQQQTFNPFGNPYAAAAHPYGPGMPVQASNAYTGFI